MREKFEYRMRELARHDDENGLIMRLESIDRDEVEPMVQFLQEQAALGFIIVKQWSDDSVQFKFTTSGINRWAM